MSRREMIEISDPDVCGEEVGLAVEHDIEASVAARPSEKPLDHPTDAARQEAPVACSAGRDRDVAVVREHRRGERRALEAAVAEQVALEAEYGQSNEPCLSQMTSSFTPLISLPPSMPRVQAVGAERSERLSTTTAEGRTSSP